MAAVAEVIVICIDNSKWMPPRSAKFQAQCDAIKIYCQAKFDAHPETVVGLYTMSSTNFCHLLHPTRSLQEIVAQFPFTNPGSGELDLLKALSFGGLPIAKVLGRPDKKLRMLLLVGGLTNLSGEYVEEFGEAFKDMGVAVDVVNFYLGKTPKRSEIEYQFGRSELDAFVNTCNRNDDSHIVHVEPKSCISDVLSKSILKKTLCLSGKENVNVKGGLQLSGKNQAGADDQARGIEYGKHGTLSRRKYKEKVNVKGGLQLSGKNQAGADDHARGIEYGKHGTLSRRKYKEKNQAAADDESTGN